ncbi:hypothetical protein BC826DRAFT_337159 [Russula brevipes]|nr:hypothetical protein BC826DRAFT_337159 [Russula brevipes]
MDDFFLGAPAAKCDVIGEFTHSWGEEGFDDNCVWYKSHKVSRSPPQPNTHHWYLAILSLSCYHKTCACYHGLLFQLKVYHDTFSQMINGVHETKAEYQARINRLKDERADANLAYSQAREGSIERLNALRQLIHALEAEYTARTTGWQEEDWAENGGGKNKSKTRVISIGSTGCFNSCLNVGSRKPIVPGA